jgi:hypothetical protein
MTPAVVAKNPGKLAEVLHMALLANPERPVALAAVVNMAV